MHINTWILRENKIIKEYGFVYVKHCLMQVY